MTLSAAMLFERGEAARLGFRHADARAALGQAIVLSREGGDVFMEVDCLLSLSLLFLQTGDPVASLAHAAEGLILCRGDARREAALQVRLGSAYYNLNDYSAALDSYLEAQRLAETVDDDALGGKALMGLGVTLGEMNRPEEAVHYLRRSQILCQKAGDTASELQAACNIGACYVEMGRHDEALAVHAHVAQTARTLGNHGLEAQARNNRGESQHALGRLAEAEVEFRAAVTLTQAIGDFNLQAYFLSCLGRLLADQKKTEQARKMLTEAARLAAQVGARKALSEVHETLARLCAESGEFADAYAHHQEFHRIEREVFSEESDQRTKTLLARRDADAARQETEQHRLQNMELEAINYALQHADAENQRLLTELRTQAQVLERLAAEDSLTGLPNRRSLDESLGRQFALAARQRSPLCVALLDVDHFKQVNDGFSHQVGDVVLQTVAGLIRRACRASDFVGRWGGEEFALVFPDTDEAGALIVCEAVRAAIEAHPWAKTQPGLAVTASLGLAGCGTAPTHERLLAQADARLYAAKHAGRNRVAGADSSGVSSAYASCD